MQFGHFLIAIFVLAGGLSILETSCNPYIIAIGDEETATRRLNLAQSFNPVGSVIGTMLAGFLILPKINLASDADRAGMTAEQLGRIQSAELSAVMGPYVGMAAVLVLLWLAIAMVRMPAASDSDPKIDFFATVGRVIDLAGFVRARVDMEADGRGIEWVFHGMNIGRTVEEPGIAVLRLGSYFEIDQTVGQFFTVVGKT